MKLQYFINLQNVPLNRVIEISPQLPLQAVKEIVEDYIITTVKERITVSLQIIED